MRSRPPSRRKNGKTSKPNGIHASKKSTTNSISDFYLFTYTGHPHLYYTIGSCELTVSVKVSVTERASALTILKMSS